MFVVCRLVFVCLFVACYVLFVVGVWCLFFVVGVCCVFCVVGVWCV